MIRRTLRHPIPGAKAPAMKHARVAMLAVASFAFGCAVAMAPPAARAESIALVGGSVHPVSGPVIPNGTVVIVDGLIASVGANVAAPAGATIVSVAGRHVYPGLIASNTTLGLVEIESVRGTVDHTEVGEINPNIRAEVELNPDSDQLPVARANGITSAVAVPLGGLVSGTSALFHLDGWTAEDMTVEAPVGLHVNWPDMAPPRAANETRSDEELKKAREKTIDGIRKAFDDARAYWQARGAEGKSGIPRHDRDAKWDAMGRAVHGEIPVIFRATTLGQIRAVLRFVDEEKLTKVILLGGDDAWRIPDEILSRHISVITSGTLGMPRHRWDAYDENFATPGKLFAAGIPFCISDGGGGFGVMNVRNLAYHAAMAAAFGLPREEALKSITLYAAQVLGVGARLGSIEPGKIADLIVTDGDPLEIATHVEQVYINGKSVSIESRHTRLFQKYDAKPRGPKARAR